jgi:hypothetical protein
MVSFFFVLQVLMGAGTASVLLSFSHHISETSRRIIACPSSQGRQEQEAWKKSVLMPVDLDDDDDDDDRGDASIPKKGSRWLSLTVSAVATPSGAVFLALVNMSIRPSNSNGGGFQLL